jgi:hypothetical protein
VEFGTTDAATGQRALQTVPVFYGDASRQASHMLRTSENSMSTVPAMAVYITDLKYDQERVQDPFFIDKLNIRTRRKDPVTGMLTSEQGDAYTVERQMPVPYRLTLNMDIWTSNTEQKLQLIEQLAVLFNPSLEIQSTDNYIDWTSLSFVKLIQTRWDSRTVPMGTDDPISIATMTFELPIWISSPAKLKVLGVIQNVIASIYDVTTHQLPGDPARDPNVYNSYIDAINDPDALITRRKLNLLGYSVVYSGNTLRLLKAADGDKAVAPDPTSDLSTYNIKSHHVQTWPGLLSQYGVINPGNSEIRLLQKNGNEIVGTIAVHPVDQTQLIYHPFVDTLPANSLAPITAIIDPSKANVINLLLDSAGNYKVAAGTRFLILSGIGALNNAALIPAWSPNGHAFAANANDIISFDGTRWSVVFDSSNTHDHQYVTNLVTNTQYLWNGSSWVQSYEGVYQEGEWEIII